MRAYIILIILISLGTTCFGMLFFFTHMPWVNLSALEYYDPGKPSIVLDDEGNEWTRFQNEPRKFVNLEKMSPHLIHAFLAAEDHNFFKHGGLSYKGIIRSLAINIFKRKKSQGASTITQQLVRSLFFDQQKTFRRKIKEQILAIAVEKQFTKELILETYLNHIYFGYGIYGVGTASERFWNKSANDLTIEEAATLAAIIPCPGYYWPITHPDHTKNRRDYIIKMMKNLGYISAADCQKALDCPIKVNKNKNSVFAYHLREQIRIFIEENFSREALYNGGLVIQTTINQNLQKIAQETFNKHIIELNKSFNKSKEKRAAIDGALVSLNPETGEIKALVGGYNFATSQFNRALQSKRQIGSIIKPIIYTAALDSGMDFDNVQIDEPIALNDHNKIWDPQNYNKKFDGPITLAQALIESKNSIAVKTLLKVGIEKVANYIKKFHIANHVDAYPSLALGCVESNVVDVAGAFNIFANKGIYNKPNFILSVKDQFGKRIWENEPVSEAVISWEAASKISKVLNLAFNHMKKAKPDENFENINAFGKTGTTNESRSCWYAGATPQLTTVVYIGRDDNQSLGDKVYPLQTAFPIWVEFNRLAKQTKQNFNFDPKLKEFWIHPITGQQMEPQSLNSLPILK